MSWDGYITNLLGQSKSPRSDEINVDKACIIGLEDGLPWTTSAHANAIKLSSGEGATIAKNIREKNVEFFQINGFLIEGVKHQFLRNDENVYLGKCKKDGAITLQKSKTAIVIAHTKEGSQQGDSNKAVAVIAEYLESLGM